MQKPNSSILINIIATWMICAASVVAIQAQVAQPCTEDFSSDTNPATPGFANSVFVHNPTGSYVLGPGFPGGPAGHSLQLFAGAVDVISFPGQSVTSASVQVFSFGRGFVIFEGAGDIRTEPIQPLPAIQIKQVTPLSFGDNNLPLGNVSKITLVGFETMFDNIEISPCGSPPPSTITVEVLVKPRSINPDRNHGLIKAVVLSTPAFDAATVDPTTVHLGDASVPFRYFPGDEDEDGDTDLIFFFLMGEVGVECGDNTIQLTGETTSGTPIEGEGQIETVGCP